MAGTMALFLCCHRRRRRRRRRRCGRLRFERVHRGNRLEAIPERRGGAKVPGRVQSEVRRGVAGQAVREPGSEPAERPRRGGAPGATPRWSWLGRPTCYTIQQGPVFLLLGPSTGARPPPLSKEILREP